MAADDDVGTVADQSRREGALRVVGAPLALLTPVHEDDDHIRFVVGLSDGIEQTSRVDGVSRPRAGVGGRP